MYFISGLVLKSVFLNEVFFHLSFMHLCFICFVMFICLQFLIIFKQFFTVLFVCCHIAPYLLSFLFTRSVYLLCDYVPCFCLVLHFCTISVFFFFNWCSRHHWKWGLCSRPEFDPEQVCLIHWVTTPSKAQLCESSVFATCTLSSCSTVCLCHFTALLYCLGCVFSLLLTLFNTVPIPLY